MKLTLNQKYYQSLLLFICVILIFTLLSSGFYYTSAAMPTIIDDKLKVEEYFNGLKFPSSMAFLGPNDILVLEKNNGTVQRIANGTMLPHPILNVNVDTRTERGMLGIAISKNDTTAGSPTYVFLFFTESVKNDGNEVIEGQAPLGNRLYRYEWMGEKLVNPKLLLDLPVQPGPAHNGGKITIGPDQNVYVVTGDLESGSPSETQFDGRSGILRVTQKGDPVENGILGSTYPLNLYYAYGIRNSFGIDFDPITHILWDTENGENYGDEINLVDSGFNSGWDKIQGVWRYKGDSNTPYDGDILEYPSDMVDFGGNGKYRSPEFTWRQIVGPTALKFLASDKLGKHYENELFAGDFHNGHIYHFELNKNRTGLILENHLYDKVADNTQELEQVIFGKQFGGVTDIQIGPDGYLYVLSTTRGGDDCDVEIDMTNPCIAYTSGIEGTIFRIVPGNNTAN